MSLFKSAAKLFRNVVGSDTAQAPPGVYVPGELSPLAKDPFNTELWVTEFEKEKAARPDLWTEQKEKLLQEAKANHEQYQKDLPRWVEMNLKKLPERQRNEILKQTETLTGTEKLQKQRELITKCESLKLEKTPQEKQLELERIAREARMSDTQKLTASIKDLTEAIREDRKRS
jgi:hypothetical protein